MTTQRPQSPVEAEVGPIVTAHKKKAYTSPVLTPLGDIRSGTLAPSPGTAESGLGQGFSQN